VIDVQASPMLRNIVMNATQRTPSSDAVFDGNSAETIYDTWLLRSPSDFDSFMPRSALSHSVPFVTVMPCHSLSLSLSFCHSVTFFHYHVDGLA